MALHPTPPPTIPVVSTGLLAPNVIASIAITQQEPAPDTPRPPYGSALSWQLRSRGGIVYVAGSYCCPEEPTNPAHSCGTITGAYGTLADVERALGLDAILHAQPQTFRHL